MNEDARSSSIRSDSTALLSAQEDSLRITRSASASFRIPNLPAMDRTPYLTRLDVTALLPRRW